MPRLPGSAASFPPVEAKHMALQTLPMTEFEMAQTRWARILAARRELLHRLEGAKAALRVTLNPPSEDEPTPQRLAELAATYLGAKRPNALRLEREIRQFEETVADGAQDFAAERARWDAALADERARLRDQAMPELKAAASRLGRLVEQIS